MTIVKIPRQYLIAEDQDSITVDVPEPILKQLQEDYQRVEKARGILKHRKAAMLEYLNTGRQEWERRGIFTPLTFVLDETRKVE